MRAKAVILILLLTSFAIPSVSAEKPLVVASIAPLAEIVKEAFGDSVNVVYLVPPGADPHQYQLTPDQIELIKRADVVVTANGHLPVEQKMKELWEEGALNAKVLFADDYQKYGFRFLPERWYNNKNNPHGVWVDPYNALAIAKATEVALAEKYPQNREFYEKQYKKFEIRVLAIVEAYKALAENATAVIEMPSQQYALEWIGVKAVASIKPEEEVPAKSVDDMINIAQTADIIAYSSQSPESLKNAALELSQRTGKPLADITTIWVNKPYTEILIENSKAVINALNQKTPVIQQTTKAESINVIYVLLALVVGISLGMAVGVLIKK
ncbi:ABC transporter substrate-binding protein [Thermococcus sp. M39]|uniref:metal ABC transporter solute-binding protein, Zn/Mn family n=1 Tax=unclassified Thermococcus TaxID=2627626 RepID=UPI00143AB687|nr:MULTISPECIES: zinc ABC transporter substrate-binding protein [unclassified Thermococcus]NJE07513.1 ABC transporter substrate-binding protein [Thermococcus sp. M39]NJE12094.1 ABC transporter substrate-binding protein [Thermococcus sp. LS2]